MATKAFSSAARHLARSKVWMLVASMALAVLLACGVALAAAGDLDPAFDGDGKMILEKPPFGAVGDVAVQPGYGLIVVGQRSRAEWTDEGSFVARLKWDGSLDSSFGGGDGVVTNNVGGDLYYEGRRAVVVRPDAKIVLASRAGYRVALFRYNANGTLDKSFGGGDGKVITDTPGRAEIYALLRQPDGKLVVAGRVLLNSSDQSLLVRYGADGTLDKSFGGGDGIAITSVGSGGAAAHDLVVRADGKLVVAGQAQRSGHQTDFALFRYNANGTVDKSFGGGDGKAYADFGSYESANALVRQESGVLVAAGYKWSSTSRGTGKFALARFTSDGGLDKSFGGGGGKVLTDVGGGNDVGAGDLVVQGDGKLIAAGTGNDPNNANGDDDFALVRYSPGGRLDTSFGGGDGKVLTDFGTWSDGVVGLALQRNGKIVAAGDSSALLYERPTVKVAVARYLAQ